MANEYWDELMPTAETVRSPKARDAYFAARFGDGASTVYLAEVEGQVIGFVRTTVEGSRASIADFYVSAD